MNYFDPNLFSDSGRRAGGGRPPGRVATAIAIVVAVVGFAAYALLIVWG